MALETVLSVDELIFEALCPTEIQRIFESGVFDSHCRHCLFAARLSEFGQAIPCESNVKRERGVANPLRNGRGVSRRFTFRAGIVCRS